MLHDYDAFYDESPNGWLREDDIPNLSACELELKNLLRAVYESGDVTAMESAIEELCAHFDIKMPMTNPIICKGA